MKRNNNILIILIVCLFAASCNTSQKEQINQINEELMSVKQYQLRSIQSNAPRYKIVQSTIAARATYKVDTYEGKVYQLVVDKNDDVTWLLLKRIGNSDNDFQVGQSRNYEIFLSTLGLRFTYLINIYTGATWQLVEDPKTKENFFYAINE